METEHYNDERTRAFETKFEGAAAPAPALEYYRNGQSVARKALVVGFAFLAFAAVDRWLKNVPERQRQEARSFAISDAYAAVGEAVDALRYKRPDIPAAGSYGYVKTIVTTRIIDGYRDRLAWRLTAAEKEKYKQNYVAWFTRKYGEPPPEKWVRDLSPVQTVNASALVEHVDPDLCFWATFADTKVSVFKYVDLFAADDFEAALLTEQLSNRTDNRTNVIDEMIKRFPGTTAYKVRAAIKTLKQRIADDLDLPLADLEMGNPSTIRMACERLRMLLAA